MTDRGVLLVALSVCTGCRQDMQIQPKYTPLAESRFFADGRAARPIPEGTIPTTDITDTDKTIERVGSLNVIPYTLTVSLVKRGQDRFNIYCSPCHGLTGDGRGVIATRGFRTPTDLTGPRVRQARSGYLYQVIVEGYGAMADYAYQIKAARDRWAVVAYLRALQLRTSASLTDAPAAARSELESER